MPLASMNELLLKAEQSNYGVGAFSITNMETIMGTIKAAEELKSPIILQVAEVRLKHSPLKYIGPLMVEAAKNASVPVAVHFDHGQSLEAITQAMDLGFTSVMFDGSHLCFEENISQTKKITNLAHQRGIDCEGEIGRVGGSEDGNQKIQMLVTGVEEAVGFARETGVDALAVAIGNAHGVYVQEPDLQFERLREINNVVSVPLVLHGGSGISHDDFRECIKRGITKINVATATLVSIVNNLTDLYKNNEKINYFTSHNQVIEGAYECVKEHILVFGSNNKV